MKRSDGERTRLTHSIARLRGCLVSLERALGLEGPVGADSAEAVMRTAQEIGMQIAKHDAFELAERDRHDPVCSTCRDTHRMWFGEEGEERIVPCTRCPSPCSKCRGHLSAYCRTTPCACGCHR